MVRTLGKKKERVRRLFEDKELVEHGHYTKRRARAILSVISVVLCVLTVIGVVLLNRLNERFNSDENLLREIIVEHPIVSALVMILICAVQVIVAFIPGEVVEIAAGYAFGHIMGAVLCTVGITLGSVCAILIARRFGRKLVEAFYPREKLDSLPILNDPKKRNALTAILFLIPGTPKDLITYIVGLTEMSIPLYILLTTICRFPSVFISTLGGDALGENKLYRAVIFFVIAAVVSGVGYLIYLTIQKKTSKKNTEDKPE